MSDVQANYDAMHVAADAEDADRTKELGDAVIADTEATDDMKAAANWRVGDTFARAGRYAEAKPYLQQAAALGDASLQERSFQMLSDLAQFEAASTGDMFDTSPVRRIMAAKEAMGRSDPDGARQLAAQVFEDDEAETVQKVEAALIAADACFQLGEDDNAELWANWAAQSGDADQKAEAKELLARWKGYATADRSMDDGVTKKDRRQVLATADAALSEQDWATAQKLLLELKESLESNDSDADDLTEAEFGEVAFGLGQTYYYQHDYESARYWFQAVAAGHPKHQSAQEFFESIDQLLQQTQAETQ